MLSPFTVNAQEDRGYQAQSTLAGSRLKTELKDIANPVMTPTQYRRDHGKHGANGAIPPPDADVKSPRRKRT